MNDIIWLTMRRMRTPLMLMILVYSLSVFGMTQIPGQDEAGHPVQVGYLDAVYFIASLATTIGFGEIPTAFTHAQRLYVFIILFPNVIAWLYSIGTIISLFVDPQFRAVMARSRFARRVRRMNGGFYIVCGFGHTGRMIVKGLLKRGISAAVIERDQGIIHSMSLDEDFSHLPALVGSVTDRRLLDMAGLSKEIKHCLGVLVQSNSPESGVALNTKIETKSASLKTLSETGAEGLEVLLGIGAVWQGVIGDIIIVGNTDFKTQMATPKDLLELMGVMQGGGMTKQDYFNFSKKNGYTQAETVEDWDKQTMIETVM